MKGISASIITLCLCMAGQALADSDRVDCHTPENIKLKNEAKKNYEDMLANDKAGKYKPAHDAAVKVVSDCISNNEQEIERIENDKFAVIERTSKKLGGEAEDQGKFTEAYDYFKYYDGIAADRVRMKLATAKPDDLKTVQSAVWYFRDKQEKLGGEVSDINTFGGINNARRLVWYGNIGIDHLDAIDPGRDKRLQVIRGNLGKLNDIVTKNAEKFLADEDKVFVARKTSVTAKIDSLHELKIARDWFEVIGQESRANDRAVKRGDTLAMDDGRRSIRLAMDYYQFAGNEAKVAAVMDKAKRLGDNHLQKGDKIMASEYYNIAGLHDKAIELSETHAVEKEQAETKRQEQFRQEQKSLEEELGF